MVKFVFLTFLVSEVCFSFVIHGHRGARFNRSENTLASFDFAIKARANYIELDVVVSREGEIIISHDPIFKPEICLYPNGSAIEDKIFLRNMTTTEIKKFDCGTKLLKKFPEQISVGKQSKIPLKEFFVWLKNHRSRHAKKININIELKIKKGSEYLVLPPKFFTQKVVDLVEEFDMDKRVILQSFDLRTISYVESINQNYKTSALFTFKKFPKMFRRQLEKLKIDNIAPRYTWVNKSLVTEMKKSGIGVIPWTVNKVSDWNRLIKLGVNQIITDNPKGLREFLETLK